MDNKEYTLTRSDYAKSLGISVDTLKKRMKRNRGNFDYITVQKFESITDKKRKNRSFDGQYDLILDKLYKITEKDIISKEEINQPITNS